MKRIATSLLILAAVAVVSSRFAASARVLAPGKQFAVVEFADKVKLMNVLLVGKYLFVHDDEKMARGEPCTWIYRQTPGQPDELILSFHCRPIERKPVDHFTVTVVRLSDQFDLRELKEYQFAGSNEGHRVPEP